MTEVIYLAPLCQEHERMWCEHDAPVDCECIDGPHPWIKYVAAMRQPTQSDALREENERLRSVLQRTLTMAEVYAEGTGTNFKEAMAEARAALQEQSK